MGVAVFKEDKLVGELNALETICLLNVTNNLDQFLVSVPDPANNNHYIDIYLTPLSNADIKVNTNSGSPYIKVNCRFSGRIYSMSENSEYLSPEALDAISNSCSSYLESIFTDYLYRTSKDLQSDISGFGKYALKNFFTTKESTNYDWRNSYKDAFFDVKIDASIKSGMLITQT
ncbi:MAG: Ger(x)C family spore germination C-terminal domain-containing protein [Clostridia bacterium]